MSVSEANAQLGAVKVGGDWISSSLIAGIDSVGGRVGDGNDVKAAGGAPDPNAFSKIASITIGGQVLGTVGEPNRAFGFGAEFIGSFKVGGSALALKPGAHNDTFAGAGLVGDAIGVGATPGGIVNDGVAVHVFEV